MTHLSRWHARILCAGAVLATLSLYGCSREADDWRSAQSADTSAAYQQFLKQYPGSSHLNEANTRIGQLAEDEAWQLATSQDTQAGYQQFATRFPDGKWAQEARVRIENFTLAAPAAAAADSPATVMANMAGAAAVAPKVPASPEPAPVKPAAAKAEAPAKSSAPKPAQPAKVASASGAAHATGGYGVQLGAYSSHAKAEAAWSAAAKRHKAELGGVKHQIQAGKSGAAKVYRLRVAQSSEAAARSLCDRLKGRHQTCVVYHP